MVGTRLSLETMAPRNERKAMTMPLQSPSGSKFDLEVEFYPNRLTLEPIDINRDDDDDETRRASWNNAASFCDIVASWGLTGPLANRQGEEVVAEGEMVPLEPETVLLVPTWVTTQITAKLLEVAFPNLIASQKSRRR